MPTRFVFRALVLALPILASAAPAPVFKNAPAACAWAEGQWGSRWVLEGAHLPRVAAIVAEVARLAPQWPGVVCHVRKWEQIPDRQWTGAGRGASAWWDGDSDRIVYRQSFLAPFRTPGEKIPAGELRQWEASAARGMAETTRHELGHALEDWLRAGGQGAAVDRFLRTPGGQHLHGAGTALYPGEQFANAFAASEGGAGKVPVRGRAYLAAWRSFVARWRGKERADRPTPG